MSNEPEETPPGSALVYDWNTAGTGYPRRDRPIELDDETLRDGLQSPSVRDPDIETKKRLLPAPHQPAAHGLPGRRPRRARGLRGAGERGDRRADRAQLPRLREEILEICKFEEAEEEHPLPLDTLAAWKTEIEGR
jgi:2-isopropylmalate synthase